MRPGLQAQLIKEAAVMKQKLSAAQSSLAQAEQAKAASADTILLLKQEVESAKHLSRLARGDEFLAVRKANQRLSVRFLFARIHLWSVFYLDFVLTCFLRVVGNAHGCTSVVSQ